MQHENRAKSDNAYRGGWNDGANDHMAILMKSPSRASQQTIWEFRQVKIDVFQVMADRRERNGLSSGVLAEYRRGWVDGFDSVATR